LNSEDHLLLGGLIGFGGYVLFKLANKKPLDLIELIFSSMGGAVAGILPDLLEPATNPNHRSFFHSIASLTAIIQGNNAIWDSTNQNLTEEQKAAISILSASYCSHLVTDGITKKGLPLIM
jgi:hypothetical protein